MGFNGYTVSEIAIKTSMNMYFLYVIYYLIIGKIYKKHVSSMLELVTVGFVNSRMYLLCRMSEFKKYEILCEIAIKTK